MSGTAFKINRPYQAQMPIYARTTAKTGLSASTAHPQQPRLQVHATDVHSGSLKRIFFSTGYHTRSALVHSRHIQRGSDRVVYKQLTLLCAS